MTLFSICDIPFWLLWLLPFLFGIWGWLSGRSKYSNMVAEYDGKVTGLNGRIGGLEGDLSACSGKRADLEGDLAITKGRMREMEAKMKNSSGAKGGNSDGEIKGLKSKIRSLEADLIKCKSKYSALESSKSIDSGNVASSLAASPIVSPPPSKKSVFSGIKDDNFQIIEGVGPKMESILKESGLSNMSQLAKKSTADIQAILDKYGDKYKIIDCGTWVQQSKLAASGKYEELIDLQKKLDAGKDNAIGLTDSKLEKYLIKTGALKTFKQDDLKEIEGIGPATEKLLHENGIKTWRELANTDAGSIKAILTAAGSRFALGDPTTWPKQAEMAADGKFDELIEYQDFLDGGRG